MQLQPLPDCEFSSFFAGEHTDILVTGKIYNLKDKVMTEAKNPND